MIQAIDSAMAANNPEDIPSKADLMLRLREMTRYLPALGAPIFSQESLPLSGRRNRVPSSYPMLVTSPKRSSQLLMNTDGCYVASIECHGLNRTK